MAVPVAEDDVVFSTEVVGAAVVRENEPVDKQRVAVRTGVGRVFSKQRSASARQRLLLDLAQSEEQILAHFAQDDLLSHLKGGYVFAMLERLLLASVVVALQQDAAALQHLGKLQIHLPTQELHHG